MLWSLCDCWAYMTSHLRLWVTLRHLNNSKLQKAKAEKILQPEAGQFTLIRIGLRLLVVTWQSGEVTRKYVLLVISWHVHSCQNDLITFVETLLGSLGISAICSSPRNWLSGQDDISTRRGIESSSNRDRIVARASQIKILGFGLGYVPWRCSAVELCWVYVR